MNDTAIVVLGRAPISLDKGQLPRVSTSGAPPPASRPQAGPIGSFNALGCFQPSGPDRVDELLVVALVLVGIALREVGDRVVERVAAAQVRGHGDRVPGPGVRPGQGPPADSRVEGEPER